MATPLMGYGPLSELGWVHVGKVGTTWSNSLMQCPSEEVEVEGGEGLEEEEDEVGVVGEGEGGASEGGITTKDPQSMFWVS